MTDRVCFLLHLKPELVDEYLEAHAVVWPDMLDALSRTGWRNYSLFLRPDDGLVVGYLETDDFEAAQTGMEAEEVNARWQAGMSRYFDNAGRAPDAGMERLTEYFHLA
ncbi:L-rhamnose mutarotase [Microbacteriaceae bacterium VKM Ac-2855]|nr:L-rhamnose mutarotase [Microbacteriaceae bacterium VKM Ac-2855]